MATMTNCVKHRLTYHLHCPICAAESQPAKKDCYEMDEFNIKLPEGIVRSVLYSFMWAMERKLKKNDHKRGWRDLPIEAIKRLLDIERQELEVAMEFLSVKEAMDECVDLANFALILHDRLGMEEDKNSGATK